MFWDVRLRRQLKDEELDFLVELLGELYGMRDLGMGDDVMRWAGSKCGKFSVSSFCLLLGWEKVDVGPWRAIWFPGLPLKVSFFVWMASLNRILTIDNLIRRGWVLVNGCCVEMETVDHLLLHCVVASQLWPLIFAIFGLTWAQAGSVASMLASWSGGRVGRRRRKAWFFAPHYLMWSIWLERNRRTFRDVVVPISHLKSCFMSTII